METICFNFITGGVGAVVVLVLLWITQPIFAAVILGWLCLHLGITFAFLRYGNQLWAQHADSISVLSGKIVDAFTNIVNVRLFARGRYETEYLKEFQHKEIREAKRAMWINEFMRICLGLVGLAMFFTMVFLLVWGWSQHWVTLGDFTQVSMQMLWLMGWAWFITFQLAMFVRETGTIGAALSMVIQGHDIMDQKDAKALRVVQGEIKYEHVNFAYQEKRVVFQDFNVVIPAGQRVGLVGFSGSGKSTFVNLILRFYDIQSGCILIDEQNIAEVTQNSLREQIAMIPQDPVLFHRSLMDNIRYGRLDASDEEVIHASKLAPMHRPSHLHR
jgi:ATP-binding cassette subfamily B protein